MGKTKPTQQSKAADAMNNQPAPESVKDTEKPRAVSEVQTSAGWGFDQWEKASTTIWRMEPGEAVMGVYHSFKVFDEGEFDQVCLAHIVEDYKSGRLISFIGGSMLDKFLAEAPIGKGTKVFIEYLGRTDTKRDRKVNEWDVRYDPSTACKDPSLRVKLPVQPED